MLLIKDVSWQRLDIMLASLGMKCIWWGEPSKHIVKTSTKTQTYGYLQQEISEILPKGFRTMLKKPQTNLSIVAPQKIMWKED